MPRSTSGSTAPKGGAANGAGNGTGPATSAVASLDRHRSARRYKAMALLPLALLSGAWTASILTGTANADDGYKPLPDGTSVPSKAIQAPASVAVPGQIAPGVPDGSADQVISSASANGIPAPAVSAYQRSAQIIDSADKACKISWQLVGAIGRVESDHGRYGGNSLTADGVSKPGVFGPVLNGKDGTQAIHDTDAGQLDKDPVWDRAVGPMQFIPSTWQVVKVDADGDGQRNPQDIDDASLATAVYLCSGNDDLSTRAGQEKAVYRYNHSQSYVDLVLRLMDAYAAGDYTTTPAGAPSPTTLFPSNSPYANPGGGGHGKKDTPAKGSRPGTTSPATPSSPTAPDNPANPNKPSTPGKPGAPKTPKPKAPSLPTTAPTQVVQPTVKTLNDLGQAGSFCTTQLQQAGLSGSVLTKALPKCIAEVGNKTKADAVGLVPNTLCGVLNWLNLDILGLCKK